MKWLKVWCVSCICILFFVGHDYHLVSIAGNGRVGTLLVRYLTFGVDSCVYVQTFSPAGGNKLLSDQKLCSAAGESFVEDFSFVELKRGWFESDRLYLELGMTPLRAAGEMIKICEVLFENGKASHLQCIEETGSNDWGALSSHAPGAA
jgi:hypothetical protein